MATSQITPTAKVIVYSCEAHGHLHEAAVYCDHDAEAETRRVLDAHRAIYGAGCKAMVTVELLDLETREPVPESKSKWRPV
jgi:hypothetical protein